MDINLVDYQEKYIEQTGFNINKYLSFNYFNLINFNKDNLRKSLEEELIKYKLDIDIGEN